MTSLAFARRIVVTSAPPNPNGDLHLGHLAGPFLGADVLRRYLCQTGHQVCYVGYSDDYSCYVPRRASELGCGPEETAHVFGRRMEQTLGLADMSHDYFTHPLREPVHSAVVQRYFRELWDRGAFEVAELPVYWCAQCERYLYEAEMRGLCQFCAAPSDGFYCEECGQPQDSAGLAEPRCTACRSRPETRTQRRIVFPLENYRELLREYYTDRPMRPRLRAYLDGMLSRPLPATPVSRESGYGIPVPLPEWFGHILDTWYSGIWGYVAATVGHAVAVGRPEEARAVWADPRTGVFQFIGFDCSFSHAILWPALLLAHGGFRLPDQVVTNEFYRLEGEKFSTSRGHAIWGNEFLRRVPADQLRFYLCLTGPERAQTSFSAADFAGTVREVLVDGLQRWLDTVFRLSHQDFGGAAPAAEPAADGPLAELSKTLAVQVAAALEPDGFSPQSAAAILREAVESCCTALAGLLDLRERDPDRYPAGLALHLDTAARLAAVAAPIMPAFSRLAWTALGLPFSDAVTRALPWPSDAGRLVPAGQRVATRLPEVFRPVLD
jgi:methionyl-tRNA synthetase